MGTRNNGMQWVIVFLGIRIYMRQLNERVQGMFV